MRILISLVFLFSAFALLVAGAEIPGFASFYTGNVYPLIVRVIGGFSGLFPFALSEVLLYLLIILLAVYTLRHIFRPALLFSTLLFAASLLFLIYALCCGVNYHSPRLADALGLKEESYTADDLIALTGLLAGNVADEGVKGCEEDWREESREAMIKLSQSYEAFSGFYPLPKPVYFSRLLSIQQVSGIYSPFTVEALYNSDMPDFNIPFAMCHELTHLRGFMQEAEANFAGFLACIGSTDPDFRYSGYLTGFIYAARALSRADPAAYKEIYGTLSDKARADLAANDAYWERFEGPVAEAHESLNDAYLKAAGDALGTASYDRFTSLMLSYYFPLS